MKLLVTVVILFIFINADVLAATPGIPAITFNTNKSGGSYTLSLQILLFMTALTLLPGLLMTMTSFIRVIVVLSILRQAMGLAQTPTNQVLLGISLFMTFFIMSPVLTTVNDEALQPYLSGKLSQEKALKIAQVPFKTFMLNQTRNNDLTLFTELSGSNFKKIENIPLHILLPAYITSELKTAFQIGFLLFLPFLIIDMVVASTLMSMGMMMLSPLIISLPFKIMMFVMIDGWTLILGTIASSFSV